MTTLWLLHFCLQWKTSVGEGPYMHSLTFTKNWSEITEINEWLSSTRVHSESNSITLHHPRNSLSLNKISHTKVWLQVMRILLEMCHPSVPIQPSTEKGTGFHVGPHSSDVLFSRSTPIAIYWAFFFCKHLHFPFLRMYFGNSCVLLLHVNISHVVFIARYRQPYLYRFLLIPIRNGTQPQCPVVDHGSI